MIKKLAWLLVAVLLMSCGMTVFAAEKITVNLNGSEIPPLAAKHEPAFEQGGTVYLPLRNVFEAMGAAVEWVGFDETVYGGMGFLLFRTVVGSYSITVDNVEYQLSVPVLLVNNRTFVEPQAVENVFGATTVWNAAEKTVNITYIPQDHSEYDFSDLEESYDE